MDHSLSTLFQARYGAAAPEAAIPSNAVLEALLSHRSVRSFLPDALPEGTLETLVAAGQSAGTSSNLQAWSVVAVEDPGRRARLAELAGRQGFAAKAPLFLCFIADTSRLRRLGERQGQPMEGLDYLEAFIVAAVDAALAAQNVVVAAESRPRHRLYRRAAQQAGGSGRGTRPAAGRRGALRPLRRPARPRGARRADQAPPAAGHRAAPGTVRCLGRGGGGGGLRHHPGRLLDGAGHRGAGLGRADAQARRHRRRPAWAGRHEGDAAPHGLPAALRQRRGRFGEAAACLLSASRPYPPSWRRGRPGASPGRWWCRAPSGAPSQHSVRRRPAPRWTRSRSRS
ncbi:nitroreductase family protein [Pseudoroseomonas wenyumeiae]